MIVWDGKGFRDAEEDGGPSLVFVARHFLWDVLGWCGLACRLLDWPAAAERCLRPLPPHFRLLIPGQDVPMRPMWKDMAAQAHARRHARRVPVCRNVHLEHPASLTADESRFLQATAREAVAGVQGLFDLTPKERVLIAIIEDAVWPLPEELAFCSFSLPRFKLCIRHRPERLTGYAAWVCHEYAHVLFRSLAGFGVPLWLEEGFCEYTEVALGLREAQARPDERLLDPAALDRADALCDAMLREGNYKDKPEYRRLVRAGQYIVSRHVAVCGVPGLVDFARRLRDQDARAECIAEMLQVAQMSEA